MINKENWSYVQIQQALGFDTMCFEIYTRLSTGTGTGTECLTGD